MCSRRFDYSTAILCLNMFLKVIYEKYYKYLRNVIDRNMCGKYNVGKI